MSPSRDLHSEASSRLAAVIETATDGIIIISKQGIMEVVNNAAALLFGYDKSEMLDQNVSMLMSNPHQKQHDGYISNYINTGEAKIIGIGREVYGLKKDGTQFPLRLSISEVQLPDKIAFTGIIHDLTKEKAFEAEIKALNTEL